MNFYFPGFPIEQSFQLFNHNLYEKKDVLSGYLIIHSIHPDKVIHMLRINGSAANWPPCGAVYP